MSLIATTGTKKLAGALATPPTYGKASARISAARMAMDAIGRAFHELLLAEVEGRV
jgi:hypothetical protein